jgi:hypothetical protein
MKGILRMSDLYEMIVNELNNKSIAALLFLLDNGRELSFEYNNTRYAITWNGEKLYLDNENHNDLQKFDDTWNFIENALLQEKTFIEVWEDIKLINLF